MTSDSEAVTGPMANPPHPGETLREDILPTLGLSVTDAASQLGVTRVSLSRVLNGHTFIPISLLRGPFVETSFAGSLEYGATESDAPRYDLNGAPIGTNNDSLSVVGQRLGFQFKIADWIAMSTERSSGSALSRRRNSRPARRHWAPSLAISRRRAASLTVARLGIERRAASADVRPMSSERVY